jgi:Recombinase
MSRNEYLREIVKGELDASHIREMQENGWKPRAVEWEREVTAAGEGTPRVEDVPYGLQIAPDCGHLEENPDEMRILFSMMELVVQDRSLSRMAEELNRRGYATRDGQPWTQLSVYNIFPRLVDVTPRIFQSENWKSRRSEIPRVAWNS